MNDLNTLLEDYQQRLFAESDLELAPNAPISTDTILCALEDMLGVNCGGCCLAEALHEWLLQPAETRVALKYSELAVKWEADRLEMESLVDEQIKEST